MIDVPGVSPAATPLLGSIVATAGVCETHVIAFAGACSVPSLKSSIAVKVTVVPVKIVGFAGETCSDTAAAAPTVASVSPLTPQKLAITFPVPCPTAVNTPVDCTIVATPAAASVDQP